MNRHTHFWGPVVRLTLCCMLWNGLMAAGWAADAVVEISHAWARATVPGQKVAGVYLELHAWRDARLVGVRSPQAKSAEIHSMKNDGGVMRMRKLDGLDLPAGKITRLEPGGEHIMLLDIERPLEPGDKVPLTLMIEHRGKKSAVSVEAQVRPIDAQDVR